MNDVLTRKHAADEARLLARLEALGIATATVRHPPVFTVEEARAHRGDLPGGHCKCLFLKSKKGELALAVALEDARVDLKALSARLGCARFSFARAELLEAELGVTPGSVTPFALINRQRRGGLAVVLDAGFAAYDAIHFHPLHNAATTAIAPDDLARFVRAMGYEPLFHDFGRP